jgi:hypothetical protein
LQTRKVREREYDKGNSPPWGGVKELGPAAPFSLYVEMLQHEEEEPEEREKEKREREKRKRERKK